MKVALKHYSESVFFSWNKVVIIACFFNTTRKVRVIVGGQMCGGL